MIYIKLLIYLLFVLSLFWVDSLYYCTGVLVASALVYLFYPDRRVQTGVLPIGLFALSVFISNLFMFSPGRVIYSFWGFTITDRATELAVLRTTRVIGLVYGAKLLTTSSTAEEIILALKRLFGPLNRLGIKTDGFFDTVMLTIKMLPAVKKEAILRVERKNKLAGSNGNLFSRIKVWIDVLVNLMVDTIRMPEAFLNKTGNSRN